MKQGTPLCITTKKVCYSKKDAETMRNYRTEGKSTNHAEYLRIYPCPYCKAWHLTSSEMFGRDEFGSKHKKYIYERKFTLPRHGNNWA